MLNAQQIADKWARNTAASGEAFKAGVEGVTQNPAAKAAAAKDRWVAGVQEAAMDGRFERGLAKVSLADWKQSMIDKGLPRIAGSTNLAKPKVAAFLQKFIPHLEAGKRMLESTPRGDINTNIQRMIAMVRHNASFKSQS